MENKLSHKNNNERLIAEYLKEKIKTDKELYDAIDKADTNIENCWKYIVDEARKILKNQSGALEDNVVYELAEKYFKEYKNKEAAAEDTQQENKKDIPISNEVSKDTTPVATVETSKTIEEKEVIEEKKKVKTSNTMKIKKVGNQLSFDI